VHKKINEKHNFSERFLFNLKKKAISDIKSWGPLKNRKPEAVHIQA
jgi:hypothetical protein